MRHSSRLLALVLLAALPADAPAADRSTPTGARAAAVVREFWGLVADVSALGAEGQEPRPRPQAIPQAPGAGATVPLDDLSAPTELESTLREAIGSDPDHIRLTVPGGTARLGDFSIGSSEVLQGPLLVVRGDATVYGRLMGNLVTIEGDV
ncbi:MAG TPA: hypothetical protein VMN37_10145, partial [Gemmatimonadales bacterium]|nr:hypothetical protein [Gemmatimonadales bacterium]